MTAASNTPSSATPPNVLLLGAEWFDDRPGGLNRYVRDLVAAFDKRDPALRAVVIGPGAGAPATVVPASRTAAVLPLRLAAFTRAAARAGRTAEVIDAHFALYALLPVTMTRLRRRPLVVHFHGPWADESRFSSPAAASRAAVKRAVEGAVYRRADEFIVLSDAFRRMLIDRYRVPPWSVNALPPTVDLGRFAPGDVVAARRELGLPENGFLAVVARRLEPRMGLEVLLESWVDVVATRPDAVLVVIGAGKLRETLERRVAACRIGRSVRFLGRVDDDDLVRAYRAADVSVVPTVALEGFGLVVLESLATGTPAVVTDLGGLPEAVAGLEGAAIVPPGDGRALAEALLAAAAGAGPSPEACRRHAATFSAEALARRHEAVYERARTRKRRPRVLFVDHCAQRSGGELAMLRLLEVLDVDAHVLLGEDGPLVELLRSQGGSCEVLPLGAALRSVRKDDVRPGRLPIGGVVEAVRSLRALRRRIRELRPDVVHTNSLKAALYGGLAARLAGVPVVWHIRDRIAEDYLPAMAVRLVRAAAGRVPNAVIANSAATLATLGPLPKPVYVVPSPVAQDGPAIARIKEPGEPLVVGMVGRLAPWKGQDVFLRAFARAFPGGGATAVIVGGALFGEDDYERTLHALADGPTLRGRVRFTGHVEDVASELRSFDVLVHASIVPEPFGQVVLEGMAAGVPVVAGAAGGPGEIITDGVDGLLHRPGDEVALASLLSELAADPRRRARLAAAGRRRAEAFSPATAAAAVLEVYRHVLR